MSIKYVWCRKIHPGRKINVRSGYKDGINIYNRHIQMLRDLKTLFTCTILQNSELSLSLLIIDFSSVFRPACGHALLWESNKVIFPVLLAQIRASTSFQLPNWNDLLFLLNPIPNRNTNSNPTTNFKINLNSKKTINRWFGRLGTNPQSMIYMSVVIYISVGTGN